MADRSPSPMRGRGRSIGALLLCSFSSSAGTIALTTIVGKFVYDLSGSELDLGLLGLAQFLPAFLLVLVAGTIIDGADRRRVAAAGAIGQAGVVAVLAWYVGTKPTSVVPIFGLVLLFGVGQAFSAPAMRLLPADMVGAVDLPWLIARNSVAGEAGLIAGPVVTAFLYTVDVRVPFVAIAALLVVSAVAITPARLRPDVHAYRTSADSAPAARPARGGRPKRRRKRSHRAGGGPLGRRQSRQRDARGPGGPAVRPGRPDRSRRHLPRPVRGALRRRRRAPTGDRHVDQLGVGVVDLGWLRAASFGIGAGAMTLLLAARPVWSGGSGRTLLAVVRGVRRRSRSCSA